MRLGQRMDLTGKRYGQLTVISENRRSEKGKYYWNCICDCGNKKIVDGYELRRGNIKSCGCLQKIPPIIIKHNMSHSKLYSVWTAMKQRCNNKKDKNYKRYGGRGITVDKRWKEFEPFMKWAYLNGYVEGETDLDRINNDKGYSPENCRFVNHRKNLLNTHRRIHDTIMGEDISISEAAEKYGFTYNCLYRRYKKGIRGDDLIKND